MAVLTPEEVAHVARLARLHLAADEMETMRLQLSSVLEHIDRLNQVDTSAIPPTAQVFALRDVLRADVPRPSFPAAAMLANAPDAADGCFKVPAVLDTEAPA
ncbi:MAG TPA: Asp-tRNA(Asn)/Glu-tRNA(Gln) amidotransferase subunit GatC [Chloroflexia bacterium]|nr:Asp-tRNA(Asn)/Glu-tRNA(Gln) amidotransferase subunit GatC [Chloroflexia bacterium]